MAIEIVDLPIKKGDVPSFFVCLPEGIPKKSEATILCGYNFWIVISTI
jgi:hypothetical protein